jgi:hypothetical protein
MIMLSCLAVLGAAGCSHVGVALPPERRVIDELSELRYPSGTELGDDLDIIIVRNGPIITLTNRTAEAYRGQYLWINRQYVSQVELIRIGTGNRLELPKFINLHGEPFPVGAWLTPDKSRRVIHAVLYNPATKQRHRLVVRFSDS